MFGANAEVFIIYQVLKTFEVRKETGAQYMVFSDSKAALARAMTDRAGLA